MKRLLMGALAVIAVTLVAATPKAFAQSTFKLNFEFKAAGFTLPKGEYSVKPKDATHLTLRHEATGKETDVLFSKRLDQPKPALKDPQLVFSVVGDFAPSYTEYITVYVLSEVWLPGADGYVIREMRGAHKTEIVKGEKAK